MDLMLSKQPVTSCELLCNAAAEHPIECDVLLPDYCPDIVRVISCQITHTSYDAAVNNQKLLVDGLATITLCYQGEVGSVKKTEYKVPFSKIFDLPREPVNPVWYVDIYPSYLNCRAISKRRLDMRGAVMICAKVYGEVYTPVVDKAQNMGMQLKTKPCTCVRPAGQITQAISVREELGVPAGKNNITQLLRADAKPVVTDCKIIGGKAIIKGELAVHLLYQTDGEPCVLETRDYSLPISQAIAVGKVSDNALCSACIRCVSLQCDIDGEMTSGSGKVLLEASLMATVRIFEPVKLNMATDCYSTEYESENETAAVKLPVVVAMPKEVYPVKTELAAPQNLIQIEDVWVTPQKTTSKVENSKLVVSCKLSFTVLCLCAETGYETATQSADVIMTSDLGGYNGEVEFVPLITAMPPSATASDNKITIMGDLMLGGTALGNRMQEAITDITVLEENPKTKANPGIIIYYARPGDELWDIAKRYSSEAAKIMTENALEDETIDLRTPLIIPV